MRTVAVSSILKTAATNSFGFASLQVLPHLSASCYSKLLERILFSWLVSSNPLQSGICPYYSVETALTKVTEDPCVAKSKGPFSVLNWGKPAAFDILVSWKHFLYLLLEHHSPDFLPTFLLNLISFADSSSDCSTANVTANVERQGGLVLVTVEWEQPWWSLWGWWL